MNYELFMGEALAEAQIALDQGKAPIGAVAVVNDAMVARAHDRVQEPHCSCRGCGPARSEP